MAETKNSLESYHLFIDENSPKVAEMYKQLIENQQNLLTDEELEEAVANGFESAIQKWKDEYKSFYENQFTKVWEDARKAAIKSVTESLGTSIFEGIDIDKELNYPSVMKLINAQNDRFLKVQNDELDRTIDLILQKCKEENFSVKETAQMIRLSIGLPPKYALSLWNYMKEHSLRPPTSSASINKAKKKPRKAPIEDLAFLLQYELELILRYISLFGNNNPAYQLWKHSIMRIGLAVGLIDGCKKVWATAEDEKVCKECGPLHDNEIAFDEYFFDNAYSNGLVPPEHYNCRCDANYPLIDLPGGFEQMDFGGMEEYYFSLGNLAARTWYIEHDEHIHDMVDDSLPLEIKARQAFELRNLYRTQTRDLMGDQLIGRRILDEQQPNPSFEKILNHKMNDKGMSYEEAIQDIYDTATKSNKSVNKKFGLG